MNDGKPLKSVYQDDPSEEQKQDGEDTPERESQLVCCDPGLGDKNKA